MNKTNLKNTYVSSTASITGQSKWLLVAIFLICSVALRLPQALVAQQSFEVPGIAVDDVPPRLGEMWLAPIEPLSTEWQSLPATISLPRGISIELKQELGFNVDQLEWIGAEEISRDSKFSIARCPLDKPGRMEVEVVSGQTRKKCTINVLDVDPSEISIGPIKVWREALAMDENSSNEEMLDYYFNKSISALVELAPQRYAVAVEQAGQNDRPVQFEVAVSPRELSPLLQVRVSDQIGKAYSKIFQGARFEERFEGVGRKYWVKPGSENRAAVSIETYRVNQINFEEGQWDEGIPLHFSIETNPAGYEEYVNWIAVTKYGDAQPRFGQGSKFTATFSDIAGEFNYWVGVKADNAVRGGDGPPPQGACCNGLDCTITTSAGCSGTWQGSGTGCSIGACSQPPLVGRCFFQVNCIDGACEGCDIDDIFVCHLGAECEDDSDCPGSHGPSTCGVSNCCLEFSFQGCSFINENDPFSQCPAGSPGACSCSPIPGSCCNTDGTCENEPEWECALDGGTYLGDAMSCNDLIAACCLPDDTCQDLTQSQCTALSGNYNCSASCNDVPDPCMGSCCLVDAGGRCLIDSPHSCFEFGDVHYIPGASCQPQGVCCQNEIDFDNSTQDCCERTPNGAYLGDGSHNDPVGACCHGDGFGRCRDTREGCCDQVAGLYQGDGTDCATSCTGACCDVDNNGACTDNKTLQECIQPGVNFQYLGGGTSCNETIPCCFSQGQTCSDIPETCCANSGGFRAPPPNENTPCNQVVNPCGF